MHPSPAYMMSHPWQLPDAWADPQPARRFAAVASAEQAVHACATELQLAAAGSDSACGSSCALTAPACYAGDSSGPAELCQLPACPRSAAGPLPGAHACAEQEVHGQSTALRLAPACALLDALWPALLEHLGGGESQPSLLLALADLAQSAASILLRCAELLQGGRYAPWPGPSRAAAASTAAAASRACGGDPAAHAPAPGQLPGDTGSYGEDGDNGASGGILGLCTRCVCTALGPEGAACCQLLSEQPVAAAAWLKAQLMALRAWQQLLLHASGTGADSGPTLKLQPLWACLKGRAGLLSGAGAVRAGAMRLMVATVGPLVPKAADGSSAAASSTTPTPQRPPVHITTDVSAWAVCQAILPLAAGSASPAADIGVAPPGGDNGSARDGAAGGHGSSHVQQDPQQQLGAQLAGGQQQQQQLEQQALALDCLAALLEGCSQRCSAGEWRKVARVVLQAATSSSAQVHAAALRVAQRHLHSHGWCAAVGSALDELRHCAAATGGPLAQHGIEAVVRAAAGAAVVGASAATGRSQCQGAGGNTQSNGDAGVDEEGAAAAAGSGHAQQVQGAAAALLAAAAVCMSDVRSRQAAAAAFSMSRGLPHQQQQLDEQQGEDQDSQLSAAVAALGLSPPVPPPGSAGGTMSGSGLGGDAPASSLPLEHTAMLRDASLLCRSLGAQLGPRLLLPLLERATEAARLAPAALPVPEPGGTAGASRGALLAAVAAAAAGAAERHAASSSAASLASAPSIVMGAEDLELAAGWASLALRVAASLEHPDPHVFGDVGGAPAAPSGLQQTSNALQHMEAALAGTQLVQAALHFLPHDLPYFCLDANSEAEPPAMLSPAANGAVFSASGSGSGGRRPAVVIEEVVDEAAGQRQAKGAADRRQEAMDRWLGACQELVPELVQLCAAYCTAPEQHQQQQAAPRLVAASPGPAAPSPHQLPLLPHPLPLFTPWSSVRVAAACTQLLGQLAARASITPRPSRRLQRAGGGSVSLLAPEALAKQDLLAACLRPLLARLRPVVVVRHTHGLEEGPLQPYQGPGTFARAVAARRVAWLLRASCHPFAGAALADALPLVLACCDDPSPAVAVHGVQALHHAALECLAAELAFQRELLLGVARRLLCGCTLELWPDATAMAVALTAKLEGKDARGPDYHALASDLLTEVEHGAHLPARRLPFLEAFYVLAGRLGLTLLRHYGRLMPLLLEWMHAHDAATQLAALGVLGEAVRATWPRAPAHAAVWWRHLLLVLVREHTGRECGEEEEQEDEEGEGAGGVAAAARRVCSLLLQCAGPQVEVLRVCDEPDGRGLDAGDVGSAGGAAGCIPKAAQGLHDGLLRQAGMCGSPAGV